MTVSRPGKDLGIDRVPKHLSKTFDLRCKPLVQRSSRMRDRARCAESRGQGPIRQHRGADWFAISIEGNPYLPEAVQISTQAEAGAPAFEGLGLGRGDRVLSIGPRFSIADVAPQAMDTYCAGHEHLACRDRPSVP